MLLLTALTQTEAAETRTAALDAMSAATAAWFAADFAGIEAVAEQAMLDAPPAGSGRRDAQIAVSFAATLAEAFDIGASVAEGMDAGDGDAASAFVRAFNAESRGEPLAALAIAAPILAAPGETSAWHDLLTGVAGTASSALGRHADAIRMTGEARRALADRLGAEHPLTTLAGLWQVRALADGSDAALGDTLNGLLALLQKRPGELPLLGMLLIHTGIEIAPAGDIPAAAEMVFDEATQRLPPGHTIIGMALEDIAYAASLAGDYRRELETLAAANAIYAARLAGDAPVLGDVTMGMAMASANLGAHDDAVKLADAALDITRAGTGGTSVITAGRFAEAATVNLLAGDSDRALALVRNARRLYGVAGASDWIAARLYIPQQEAKILMAAGRPDEAVAVQATLLADLATTHWAGSLAETAVIADRALALRAAGRIAEALAEARRALAGLTAARDRSMALAGGTGRPTTSHTLRLTAQTLVQSAWLVAGN